MQTSKIALGCLLLLYLFSCSRQNEVLVPDNTLPPDGTISNIVVESYINRAYISVLGRKPDPTEFVQAETQLRANNLSQANRESFLDGIIGTPEYHDNQYNVGLTLYLNSVDTAEVAEQIFLFQLLLTDPQYQDVQQILQGEIDRMELLLGIPVDLKNGSLNPAGMHRRLSYNYIYDQINMGTQNFVVSMFQNFLFRYPSGSELADCETMVDGFPSLLFLETGSSKEDFLDIFFSSGDYYEGQVRDLYSRFLFREPGTEELETLAVAYRSSGDFPQLLKAVLSTDEFIGL